MIMGGKSMCLVFLCSGGPSAVALLKKGWVGRLQLWCEGNRELWHPEVRKEFEEAEKVWKASWVDGMRKGVSAFRTVTVVVNTTAETFSSPHFDWTGGWTLWMLLLMLYSCDMEVCWQVQGRCCWARK